MDLNITELTKGAPVLAPDDTLRRAASLLRASDGSSTVVIDGAQIVGIITEKSLAAALTQADDREAALDTPVRTLMDPGILYINSGTSVNEAAGVFAACDLDALPVINNYGGYLGVLYRGDLVGYMTRSMKMPSVAGMATPLGVYLTTGSISGGAGSLGLFLTGMSLGLLVVLSLAVSVGIMHLLGHVPVQMSLIHRYLGNGLIARYMLGIDWGGVRSFAVMLLHLAVFRTLMQISPLAGFHAAEHMTVHAIEAGEMLTPSTVGKMPRVHPRCGTNILTGITLFMLVTTYVKDQDSLMLAALVSVLFWRSVGGWMQQYVTTRPPSASQLASGIAAGNQLIERFHENPNYQTFGFARIWKLGLLQNAAGLTVATTIISFLAGHYHIAWLNF